MTLITFKYKSGLKKLIQKFCSKLNHKIISRIIQFNKNIAQD
jgi:hypothetical protein